MTSVPPSAVPVPVRDRGPGSSEGGPTTPENYSACKLRCARYGMRAAEQSLSSLYHNGGSTFGPMRTPADVLTGANTKQIKHVATAGRDSG